VKIFVLLAVALAVAMLVSLGIGGVEVPVTDVLRVLHTSARGAKSGSLAQSVVVAIRLPRIVLSAAVGAGLATGGAALQGLFRNPLVDPTFIGATSGAAMGASLAIVFGHHAVAYLPDALRSALVPLASMAGCFLLLRAALVLARIEGRVVIAQLLLVGIALTAMAGTVVGLCVTFSDDAQARTITFWTLGSFGGASVRMLAVVLPVTGVVVAALVSMSKGLDALTLGEADAAHLGVRVDRVKRTVVLLVAAVVGVSVSMVGQIGFVGIVVPHVLRLLVGPMHRPLLLGSALGGALLLVVADTVARTIVLPAELPIGIVTGALGAPFFLSMLRQRRMVLA
jgi:iron complex transport system permease protein